MPQVESNEIPYNPYNKSAEERAKKALEKKIVEAKKPEVEITCESSEFSTTVKITIIRR